MVRRSTALGPLLPLLALFTPPLGAQTAIPPKSALVVLSSAACTVSVDGEKTADLRADEPLRLDVAPGDYVVSAVAADGRRWSRILRVEGEKRIVQIDFAASAAPDAAPAIVAAPAVPRPPATPQAAPLRGEPMRSWVLVSPGEFEMGCSPDDAECNAAELPRRHIRIEKPFEMMEKPVTVAQFRGWASSSGRRLPAQPKWSTDEVPVVNVTWDEATAFCSSIVGRLPAEIEWEYAARAGSSASRYGELDSIAWYAGNSDRRAHPVGEKASNALGLYDMLGNVWEWNADVFASAPAGLANGNASPGGPHDLRSLRGGSWRNKAKQIRVSNRGRLAPDDREDDDGFRCVRLPQSP